MLGGRRCLAYHVVLATHKILIPAPLADNLPPPQGHGFALSDHTLVGLQGMDAAAFAQAQFANDATGLADGQWQWNAWLTPKGRVIALFALLRRAADDFLLLSPDYPADALASQLGRFVFRRKLKVLARHDLRVSGSFAAPAAACGPRAESAGDAIELDFSASGGPRTLRIDTTPAIGDTQALARWFAFDLTHGLPRLAETQREHWTPQQLSLERLPAFSVKKGCYPGQEIVARTHFLGQAKRGLVLLEGDAEPVAAADVLAGEREAGRVIATAGRVALAVLALDRDDARLSANGIPLRERPLQDGLAR